MVEDLRNQALARPVYFDTARDELAVVEAVEKHRPSYHHSRDEVRAPAAEVKVFCFARVEDMRSHRESCQVEESAVDLVLVMALENAVTCRCPPVLSMSHIHTLLDQLCVSALDLLLCLQVDCAL